jgi:hypothetical protein
VERTKPVDEIVASFHFSVTINFTAMSTHRERRLIAAQHRYLHRSNAIELPSRREVRISGLPGLRGGVVALLAIAMCAGGCRTAGEPVSATKRTPDWMDRLANNSDANVTFGQAERMAVIWTDSIASASGVSSVRGFGGRIYFYDRNGQPTRVDGEITVYAFDDTAGANNTAPDRVYKFCQADLQRHYSKTQLGPSYSVWLPWDKVGGDRKSITLMAVFKSGDNQIVKSEQSKNVLPGKTPTRLAESTQVPYRVLGSSSSVAEAAVNVGSNSRDKYGVQLASHYAPANATIDPSRQRSTTIDVPRNMTRRLNGEYVSGTVDSVASGMTAQVSFGPREAPLRQSPPGPSSPVSAPRPTANQAESPLNLVQEKPTVERMETRPVFGLPGAYK